MSIRHLDALLKPRSIAVVGASHRPGSVGTVLMRNLLRGGFGGIISPVNPKYDSVQGVRAYDSVRELETPPDLGAICTPPGTVPGIVRELGLAGARAAVVITAGLSPAERTEMLAAARETGMRLLGPNCVGLLAPRAGLNCSFAHTDAIPGGLAFLSQSGGLTTAVLDWARTREIGFSCFVSLGNSLDIDAADLLDYLSADPATTGILLYLESVQNAREFLSAARAAARTRFVVAVKAGRMAEGARAAASHTGALAGADEVYDAAIGRAGMLRVREIEELFEAVETLARAGRPRGERLAILSNGGGPAVMATDALVDAGGVPATLSSDSIDALDEVLPPTWSRANPVDVIGDANAERYGNALDVLLDDPGIHAVLILHSPVALVRGEDVAREVVRRLESRGSRPQVLTCWLGGAAAEPARRILREAGLPGYSTPENAVRAFQHLVRYRRNQERLMASPSYLPGESEGDVEAARDVVREVVGEGREWLAELECRDLLRQFGIPAIDSRLASSPDDAARIAAEIGFPVAIKIVSPDVRHKTDVGGVALDLETPEQVESAAGGMAARVRSLLPDARIRGFLVQEMARRPEAHEVIIGVAADPLFGPVILFGEGGIAVEVIADRAVELPPLDANLARGLIERTRISRLLAGYRGRPPADLPELVRILVGVSRLVCALPELRELDLNPVLVDADGAVVLDARIRVAADDRRPGEHLAIRPYPRELEERIALRDGRSVLLRPIRPEDETAHLELFRHLKREDIRFRFFGEVREMPHTALARYTQIDYDREMAFIATTETEPGAGETLGVVRTVVDPDNTRAEFAIVIRSDQKGLGLGEAMLRKMIRYCADRGTGELVGQVMADNRAMLGLAAKIGFESDMLLPEPIVEVRLPLGRDPDEVSP